MANPHDAMHGSAQEEEEFDDLFDTPRIEELLEDVKELAAIDSKSPLPTREEFDLMARTPISEPTASPAHEPIKPAVQPANTRRNADVPAAKPSPLAAAAAKAEPKIETTPVTRARGIAVRVAGALPKSRKALVIIAIVVIVNAGILGSMWSANRALRSGLEDLRSDLAANPHAIEPANITTEPIAVKRAPVPTPAPEPRVQDHKPLEPYELTALALAEQEIRDGDPASARRRLHKVRALVDRIADAKLRADVEERASYLLGETYRAQARSEKSP